MALDLSAFHLLFVGYTPFVLPTADYPITGLKTLYLAKNPSYPCWALCQILFLASKIS